MEDKREQGKTKQKERKVEEARLKMG